MVPALAIVVTDGAGLGVVRHDRHLQHDAGARRDRQERRIGLRALLAQRGQHDRHHLVEAREHRHERGVEAPRRVAGGRRQEFVLEAEGIEEAAQPRVVVLAEARVRAERIGDFGERLAEVLRQQLLVRHVVGHLAQTVHVVREGDQARLDLVAGEHPEGVAHHGGARHLAERTDMRQAGGSVAGLEDHLVLRLALEPGDDLLRLLERPRARALGELPQGRYLRVGDGHLTLLGGH